jgi:hypothetical protein
MHRPAHQQDQRRSYSMTRIISSSHFDIATVQSLSPEPVVISGHSRRKSHVRFIPQKMG